MSRRVDPALADDLSEIDPGVPGDETPGANAADLAALPIVGITRRRVAAMAGVLLATWIVMAFARQVGEASAATVRYEDIASANAALRTEVASLERELDLIARQRYVEQQARAYGLGGARETAFTLAKDAPPLPADAPGSAALRVGARDDLVTPLERWLTVLFGPSD
jgi:cell division protein FtsB